MALAVTTPRSSGLSRDNRASLEVPLDYSFMNILQVSEIERLPPREVTGKKLAKGDDEKYTSKCVKLNNNHLSELTGLMPALETVIVDPTTLSWIDLSSNELTTISPLLCDFPNLQILYLQGNAIKELNEVDKLGGIRTLKKLCLHGNPIENTKGYRFHVLCIVPQLTSFDMSTITNADRNKAKTVKGFGETKKSKKTPRDRDN